MKGFDKKGIELSIGMIVTIIISILIFILAITFIFKWFGKAEVLKAEIDRQTEEQILTVLRQGTALVAIPINIKETKLGKPVTFGVGVRNIGPEQEFGGAVAFSGAYNPDGSRIAIAEKNVIEAVWLGSFKEVPPFKLRKNEQKIIPVLIKPGNIATGRPALKGDYVFNVCIYKIQPGQATMPECSPELLKVPEQVYTGKIYQVTVRVE